MKRLAELRKEKGLTQTGFAMKFNITQYMVSAYESGKNQPSAEMLSRFADFFNVSVDYLIGRTDIRNCEISIEQEAIKCLNLFNRLDRNQQKIALALLDSLKDYRE